MTNVRLTINDTVQFDGDLGAWKEAVPDVFKDVIKPGAKPKPWMASVMAATTDAYLRQQSVNIDAVHRSNRWSVAVEEV